MSHKNPWVLITSEEIAEIRRHLRILEDEGSQKCRDSASAIAEILIFVEGRLV
jgi:hypothetical protein